MQGLNIIKKLYKKEIMQTNLYSLNTTQTIYNIKY